MFEKMNNTINNINEIVELIEKHGENITLEQLYWKLKSENDNYFSD